MIRIFADSTCDLTVAECQRLQITVVPLTVHFGVESFREGIDINHEEFYRRLEKADELPTTSQATSESFDHAIRPFIEQGDECIIVTIASKLSGTYQSACIVAERFAPGLVQVVDSQSGSGGTALVLRRAVELRDEGKVNAAQAAQELRALASRICVFAVVDTLRYLWKGGRVSRGQAIIGSLLNVNPIMRVFQGEIDSVGKVRGEKNGIRAIKKLILESNPDLRYGISFMTGNVMDRLERYMAAMQEEMSGVLLYRNTLGSVIGTHVGPGVIAIAFVLPG